ncbi:ribonucleoside-triphosphate reductase, adenosylcobalamin-dependent [Nocardia abscessus]|uniref:ribonucleoside-triphosphate reductase, adenosylcobalamin-dependent n=1 Tax=Nocardia abscessus TaxID=120957 RepID=UPI00245612C8|nr:ribonucleoside-triphosphate reductase, adenosylcobalamin-dependent [Nocardia abscessus]
MNEPNWGPTGKLVYERTYSRPKPDGTKETWPETVRRVVDGNLGLVDARYQLPNERDDLIRMMEEFKILPAGRHLWASGVPGRQYLFNCHVSHWGEKPSDHFEFTFMRLMEGGGVGANYSNEYLEDYPPIQHFLKVEIVCDPEHPDYEDLKSAGLLSERYSPDWPGSFSIEDSREGWAAALVDLIDTHYRSTTLHYNRVYDVSRVRAAGSKLKAFGGTASGPVPLARMLIRVCEILSAHAEPDQVSGLYLDGIAAMEIDHAIAQCVVAGGVRRSARMSIMHWKDPQALEFINIKKASGSHWTTNISVEVDSDFWSAIKAAEHEHDYELCDCERAAWILKAIAEGMLFNGEPGFWDSSLSNVGEPNPVVATNPCGEVPLTPWENCNLGHINLAAFVDEFGVDYSEMFKAHKLMTRFLIRATYGDVTDPKQAAVLADNRRIGVGHLGVASFLALTKRKYSEAPTDTDFRWMLRELAAVVDTAAEKFCHELRIPVPVKKRTVAPTGSIAKMPGVSEGIHPIFSKYFIRRVRFSKVDPDQIETVEKFKQDGYHVEDSLTEANTSVVAFATKDTLVQQVSDIYGPEVAEEYVEAADDLTLYQMLAFQALYQSLWADNAVSYTANLDPAQYDVHDVAELIVKFGGLLKGATIFPQASFAQPPYERISKETYDAAFAKAVADGVDEECSNGSCPIR